MDSINQRAVVSHHVDLSLKNQEDGRPAWTRRLASVSEDQQLRSTTGPESCWTCISRERAAPTERFWIRRQARICGLGLTRFHLVFSPEGEKKSAISCCCFFFYSPPHTCLKLGFWLMARRSCRTPRGAVFIVPLCSKTSKDLLDRWQTHLFLTKKAVFKQLHKIFFSFFFLSAAG